MFCSEGELAMVSINSNTGPVREWWTPVMVKIEALSNRALAELYENYSVDNLEIGDDGQLYKQSIIPI